MALRGPGVVVCQIGAREHYAISRTLHRAGLLAELITDVWAPPLGVVRHLPGRVGQRLRGRYHPELRDARVTHFTGAALAREAARGLSRPRTRWQSIMAQNRWFQAQATHHLARTEALAEERGTPTVLAYSYAAKEIFQAAKRAGVRTVLAQIDGGEADESLIAGLCAARSAPIPDSATSAYWDGWREECRLADHIIVNSRWARHLLVEAGIEERKIVVIPVIYERDNAAPLVAHGYPLSFDRSRPLEVLFVGALSFRKGALEALEAARLLRDRPVRFTFVGHDPENRFGAMADLPNVRWHGRAPRSQVYEFYRNADVFLFPTHSDGFGMTQLEALSEGAPVIASRRCAELVEQGQTGLLLDEVNGDSIAKAIIFAMEHPEMLSRMSLAAAEYGAAFAKRVPSKLLEFLSDIQGNPSQRCRNEYL